MHQASREELLRLLPSVELPECVAKPLYEAGVMRALEDYEEEGVLTGYEVDPNVVSFASKFYHKKRSATRKSLRTAFVIRAALFHSPFCVAKRLFSAR